ncbi:hypothetical protein GCM10022248_30420 [Nonomuraea soli]
MGEGVQAHDAHLALLGPAVTLQGLQRRGLARAVGAEQGEHLALVNPQIDAVDGDEIAVGGPQSLYLNWCHGPRLARAAHGQ